MSRLEAQLGRLKSMAGQYEKIDDDIERLKSRLSQIETVSAGRVSATAILNEMSRIIPKPAWITDLTFSEKSIKIGGYAPDASALIPMLESSPLFKEVAFQSTITKGKFDMELFQIVMKVE